LGLVLGLGWCWKEGRQMEWQLRWQLLLLEGEGGGQDTTTLMPTVLVVHDVDATRAMSSPPLVLMRGSMAQTRGVGLFIIGRSPAAICEGENLG